jgi:hypothetical protein
LYNNAHDREREKNERKNTKSEILQRDIEGVKTDRQEQKERMKGT